MKTTRSTLFILALLALPGKAVDIKSVFNKLTNPEVTLSIRHPPSIPLKAERLAILADGAKAEELAAAITAHFVNAGEPEVLNRQELDGILMEHQLSFTDLMDPGSTPEFGRILGSTAVLLLKVHRFNSEKSHSRKTYDDKTYYYSSRTVHLKVSAQTVDLVSGKVFGARFLEYSPSSTTSSKDGYPAYPSVETLRSQAFRMVVTEVSHYYAPWVEYREITFFNGKKYDMKRAFQAIQAEDQEEALLLTTEGVKRAEKESAKPKPRSRVHYNLGVLYLVDSKYDEAIKEFKIANKIQSNKLFRLAQVNAKRAKAAEVSFSEVVKTQTKTGAADGEPVKRAVSAVRHTSGDESELMGKLRSLKRLWEEGLITDQEYKEQKSKALGSLKD